MTDKRPIEPFTAVVYLGSIVFTCAVFGWLVWVTGLYGWVVAHTTKDVLGIIAAVFVVLIAFAFMGTKKPGG